MGGGLVVIIAGVLLLQVAKPTAVKNTNNNNIQLQADGSALVGGKHYYRVISTDPAKDTGNKVCASLGLKCQGYTDLTLESCLAFHPSSAIVTDLDGAKAGFYCNGLPQEGICAREMNTCHICPACGINMDCNMQIGTLYRETFVECN